MQSQLSPAAAQEIRRLTGNKCHPALIAAQATGHLRILSPANGNRKLPSPHNGQAITAQQHEQLS